MINYHPASAVLQEYVNGNLPASVSIIIASHIEMCDKCREEVTFLTERAANQMFMDADASMEALDLSSMLADLMAGDPESRLILDEEERDMIQVITDKEPETPTACPRYITEIDVAGTRIALPRAINSIALSEWKGFGKVSRSRLDLEDNNLKASLLHISKGGAIPAHTHKGFEITLLLQGSFKDEMGEYHEGDFIWLDGQHNHSPMTEDGCICLTVSSDALHFTKGVSQLINPLGKFIY